MRVDEFSPQKFGPDVEYKGLVDVTGRFSGCHWQV